MSRGFPKELNEPEKTLVINTLAMHLSVSECTDPDEYEIQKLIDRFRGNLLEKPEWPGADASPL